MLTRIPRGHRGGGIKGGGGRTGVISHARGWEGGRWKGWRWENLEGWRREGERMERERERMESEGGRRGGGRVWRRSLGCGGAGGR